MAADPVPRAALARAQAANVSGSTEPHVVVALPSFSLGATILSHYGALLGPLEHRYLVAMFMLPRIPGEELVLVTSVQPPEGLLDYYAAIAAPDDPAAVRRRTRILLVPDPGHRSVAAKLLDRPDLIAGLRELVGDRPGLIEPWNVTDAEAAVADAIGLPLNGTPHELWPLGFKSAGRRLMAGAGVPVPCGREDVRDVAGVTEAIAAIRRERPGVERVVVKHDNSGYGDGNLVLAADGDVELPDWFVEDLAMGGIVEEMVTGTEVRSPSAQLEIAPDGSVRLLSTHEQLLGGPEGQTFVGCRFPADPAYAAELGRLGTATAAALGEAGALGRLGVDFVVVRRGDDWDALALEVNLRKGGTTHPFTVLRNLVPGHYDAASGDWLADLDGRPRHYRAADGLRRDEWRGLDADRVIAAVAAAGLGFERQSGTGVVLHMLGGLAVDGRLGYTAIGHDAAEADALADGLEEVVAGLSRRP